MEKKNGTKDEDFFGEDRKIFGENNKATIKPKRMFGKSEREAVIKAIVLIIMIVYKLAYKLNR